jgi:Omp85 superfamily domain
VTLLALLSVLSAEPSGFEERLIERTLLAVGREREEQPDGKQIEEVLIAPEEVFSPAEPWPTFLNIFHARTRDEVIRREVLVHPGEQWDPSRIAETERNLRRLFVLAIVRLIPVRGLNGGVAVLAVTKDKWSLRLNSEFTLIGGLLQSLRLQPSESNFRGLNQLVAVDLVLRLDIVSISQTFVERRLFSSRWTFSETAGLIFNRNSLALEGTLGSVALGKPILSLDQRWGMFADVSWNVRRRRIFRGASIWQLPYPTAGDPPAVPLVYNSREIRAEVSGVRSFGRSWKTDVTASAGAYTRQYSPPVSSGLSAAQSQWLVSNYLPRSETAPYIATFARSFPPVFKVLRNLNTYVLSEDVQLGPLVQASALWAFPNPFTNTHFAELAASARYRLYAYEDLLTLSAAVGVRLRPGERTANERVVVEVQNFSPPFWGGRLMTRLVADFKFNDLDNRQVLLGGSNGLRGTFPDELTGRNFILANIEFRPPPVELFSSLLGVVLFYDTGSAFTDAPVLTHSVGFGLRWLIPQFNQEVIRIDFGVVIGGPTPGIDRLNASFGQVNEIRPSFLDAPSGGAGVGALPSIR